MSVPRRFVSGSPTCTPRSVMLNPWSVRSKSEARFFSTPVAFRNSPASSRQHTKRMLPARFYDVHAGDVDIETVSVLCDVPRRFLEVSTECVLVRVCGEKPQTEHRLPGPRWATGRIRPLRDESPLLQFVETTNTRRDAFDGHTVEMNPTHQKHAWYAESGGRNLHREPCRLAAMEDVDLAGRTALVTGSAKRLGHGIPLALADGGADVGVHYHSSAESAGETAADVEALGTESITGQGDVTDPADVDVVFDAVEAGLGSMGILVNNVRDSPRFTGQSSISRPGTGCSRPT